MILFSFSAKLSKNKVSLSKFMIFSPSKGFSQSASAPVKIVEEYDDGSKTPIREQPRGEMPEPLVPEVLTSRVRVEEEVASSDFSDLVNWARGNLASTSIGTRVCSNFEVRYFSFY